jgi:hypothetical protein
MRKILSIIVVSLLLNGNAYAADPYSEKNRKKSEIKISCKIEEIVNHYAQEDGRPIALKNMFVTDVDLPSFIIETNSYEDEVWLNQVGIKARKNFPSELIFLTLQNTNKEDFVFAKKFTIKFKEKYKNGKEISFEIASSTFDKKKTLTLEYINMEYFSFREAIIASGGCHRIDPKNFVFEEIAVQNEITIAEYKARKEKELLNKKKEELNKVNITEGKFELNCKDGVLYKAGRNPEPFDNTLNRLVDINNQSYSNLNFEPEKIHYFISTELSDRKLFLEYRFDKDSVQLLGYDRDAAEFAVKTSLWLNESLYQITKKKLDEVNKSIDNYKPQKDSFGYDYYTVSNLGTKKQEYEKFMIITNLLDKIEYRDVTKVTGANYKCNKI